MTMMTMMITMTPMMMSMMMTLTLTTTVSDTAQPWEMEWSTDDQLIICCAAMPNMKRSILMMSKEYAEVQQQRDSETIKTGFQISTTVHQAPSLKSNAGMYTTCSLTNTWISHNIQIWSSTFSSYQGRWWPSGSQQACQEPLRRIARQSFPDQCNFRDFIMNSYFVII